MGSSLRSIPSRVAAEITFCRDKEYTTSHFLRLVKKVLRHRTRQRLRKLGFSPPPSSHLGHIDDEFLNILIRCWSTLDKSGIRIGSRNKWRGVRIEDVVSLPPPPLGASQSQKRQDPLIKTLSKRYLRLQPIPSATTQQPTVPDVPHEKLGQALRAYRLKVLNKVSQVHHAGRTALRKYRTQSAKGSRQDDISTPGPFHTQVVQSPTLPVAPKDEQQQKRVVLNIKAYQSNYCRALEKKYGDNEPPQSRKPINQPRLFMHNSAVWQTLTGHGKDFQKVPRFEWQALLGIAAVGKEGILQPDLCKMTGQDKRSLPRRTTELANKGHIVKRSVLKRGSKTSKMWLKRFTPALLESGPVDISRAGLAGNTSRVSWHRRWTGETIDYLALGQTAIAIIKAYGVMKHLDLKQKLGILGIRWQMRVLARTLRYWAECGVIKYVAASLEGTIFRDCLKYIKPPSEEQWKKYLATGGVTKHTPRSQQRARKEAAITKARTEVQRRKRKLETSSKRQPAWKYLRLCRWNPERPIIQTIYETIRRAGTKGTTNRMLSRAIVSRDFQRLFSRLGLALTNPNPPKHLRHLEIVNRKNRTGRILQYQYFTGSSHRKVLEKEARVSARGSDSTSNPSPPGTVATAKSPMRYSPNVFSRHRPSLTSASPKTLTDLVVLCQPNTKKKKRLPTGTMRKGRPAKSSPAAASCEPQVADAPAPTGSGVGEPAGEQAFQVVPDEPPIVASTVNTTGTIKRPLEEETSPKIEPPVKKIRLEKVFFAEKNTLDPKSRKKRKGRPKRSIVIVFNLAAFSESNRQQLRLGSPSQDQIPKGPSEDVNKSKRKKGKKPVLPGGHRCEKCGQTWRNDNGLAYHLTKSRSECNPNYNPDSFFTIPKLKPSSTPKIPSPEPDFAVVRSATGRPMRSSRLRQPQNASDALSSTTPVATLKHRPMPRRKTQPGSYFIPRDRKIQYKGSPLSSTKPHLKRKKKMPPEFRLDSPSTLVHAHESIASMAGQMLQQKNYGVLSIVEGEVPSTRVQNDSDEDVGIATSEQDVTSEQPKRKKSKPLRKKRHVRPKNPPLPQSRPCPPPTPIIQSMTHKPAAKSMAHNPTGKSRLPIESLSPNQLKCVLPSGTDSSAFKISGLVTCGSSEPSRRDERAQVEIPGEIDGFVPTPFRTADHVQEYAAVKRAPVHFWIRTIMDYLCRQNGGVFPGFKASYLALLRVWYQHLSHIVNPPQNQTLSRAIEDQYEVEPEIRRFRFQAIHAGRAPVTFELFYVPGVDPNGPIATLVKKRVVDAHPAVYIPRAFSPALNELQRFGVHFDKPRQNAGIGRAARKLAPEIELLQAPFYIVESYGESGHLESCSPFLMSQKRRRLMEASKLDDKYLLSHRGRPKDRTWKLLRLSPVYMQDFSKGTWDSTPMPTLAQRWPRTLLKKSAQAHRLINPGLHTLPLSFWSVPEIPRSLYMAMNQDDLSPSPSGIERPGPETEGGCSGSRPLEHQNDVDQIKAWELSEDGQSHLFSYAVFPGNKFINLHPPPGTEFPRPPTISLWRDEDQLTMHTLDYAHCKALDREINTSLAHDMDSSFLHISYRQSRLLRSSNMAGNSSYSRYVKTPRRRLLKAHIRDGKVGLVAHVIGDEYRQRLTVWPETKDDFPPRLGFFGLRSGQNASLTPDEQRLLITGFVCVGSLTGGINHTVDYGLMMRIFPEFTNSALSKFWLKARKERGSFVQKLTGKFEEKFPLAYADNQLPLINFEDLLNYDWKWLIKWAMDLNPDEGERDLPEDADQLLDDYVGKDTSNPDMDWRDNFYHRQASVYSRMRSFCLTTFYEPCRPKPQPEEFAQLAKSRSYIKSLCCTPVAGKYPTEEIKRKLVSLSPQGNRFAATRSLQKAAMELNNQKVTVKGNAHRDPVTGSFRLQGNFMKQLNRYCKLDRFEQAVNFKLQLDAAFKQGNAVRTRYDSGEGVVMAIVGMQHAGRLHLEGVDVPDIPMGFVPGNYESRKFNTSKNLRWKIHMKPTDTWSYDEDMELGNSPAISEIPELGPNGEIPMWRDLFGGSNPEMWLKALSYFIFNVATKGPSSGTPDVCLITKPYLERFETQLLSDWCQRAGVIVPVAEGNGYTVSEWWWWIVGKAKIHHCGDKEVVEPHRLKLSTDKPTRGRPRKRHPTIAVRYAAQEMALAERKAERKREREKAKLLGKLTRNPPNRALIKGPAERLFYDGHGPRASPLAHLAQDSEADAIALTSHGDAETSDMMDVDSS